jgi:hypothetical protein
VSLLVDDEANSATSGATVAPTEMLLEMTCSPPATGSPKSSALALGLLLAESGGKPRQVWSCWVSASLPDDSLAELGAACQPAGRSVSFSTLKVS